MKVAIIGSGPSAFYSASRLLQLLPPESDIGENLEIHMYERLPTPYGLVRYGVAPDHPEVKVCDFPMIQLNRQNCKHKFDELSSDSRFKYFGNTLISPQASSSTSQPSPYDSISPYTYPHAVRIPLSSILPYYTTLLLSYGASLSNPLNIPDRDLEGVFQALALVGWYNGHPAFSDLYVDLSTIKNVDVIGQGNVALDVARILLKNPKELDDTDLPTPILDVLHKSAVEKVSVVGRRGPAQVAFTTKELREMANLSGVQFSGVKGDLMDQAKQDVEKDRVRKRLLALMEKPSGRGGKRTFELDFLKSPKRFIPSSNDTKRAGGVEYEVNTLLPAAPDPPLGSAGTGATPTPMARSAGVKAIPTGQTVESSTDMIVESVGYRSEGLESDVVPFDVARGRVRNVGGRVTDPEGVVVCLSIFLLECRLRHRSLGYTLLDG
jgi:adrenodoxin-NADP+ reductase